MNKNDLKELNGLFNQVKDKDESEFSNYTQIPDGNYKAIIDDLEITESKAGKPMFVISYKIMEGEFKDQILNNLLCYVVMTKLNYQENLNRYAQLLRS